MRHSHCNNGSHDSNVVQKVESARVLVPIFRLPFVDGTDGRRLERITDRTKSLGYQTVELWPCALLFCMNLALHLHVSVTTQPLLGGPPHNNPIYFLLIMTSTGRFGSWKGKPSRLLIGWLVPDFLRPPRHDTYTQHVLNRA
jgi:hypothetical protein